MDRLLVISGDGHATPTLEGVIPYLEGPTRALMDLLIRENWTFQELMAMNSRPSAAVLERFDDRSLVRSGGEYGGANVRIRLAEMDLEGIAAEVVHPHTQTNPAPFFVGQSPEVRFAGVRAYHRWLADFMADADGRLFGVAEAGPCLDMDATIAEMAWARAHGFVAVSAPGSLPAPEAPYLFDQHFEQFWAACVDLGLVLSIHAGWAGVGPGTFSGSLTDVAKAMLGKGTSKRLPEGGIDVTLADQDMTTEGSQMRLGLQQPRRVLWQLMASGVLDRHPGLRIALTEIRADWVPRTLDHLTARFAERGIACALTPREYWDRQCIVVPSSIHRSEVEMRHEIGVAHMGFGQDYPHWEGMWPDTLAWCQDAFRGVPEGELRAIMAENVAAFYGLPVERFVPIAERICPTVEDLLGDHAVDEDRLQYFHRRAGYLRPADPVFPTEIDSVLGPDLELLLAT